MPPGAPLGSRYVRHECIGSGAMGRVFRASVRSGGPDVAVKVLREDLTSQPGMMGRLVRESEVLRHIDHENVVRVLDLVVESDQVGLVMDLVVDGDLRQALPPPLAAEQALSLMAQIADGLQAVHQAGLVHRDLKPENVLVESLGSGQWRPRITDFGIARLAESVTTKLSSVLGTPAYLSPETVMGESASTATDVYSLGIMVFEWLTGQRPFVAENGWALVRAHREDPVPRLVGAPAPLQELLDRMLAKEPAQRPSALEVSRRLRALVPELSSVGSLLVDRESVRPVSVGASSAPGFAGDTEHWPTPIPGPRATLESVPVPVLDPRAVVTAAPSQPTAGRFRPEITTLPEELTTDGDAEPAHRRRPYGLWVSVAAAVVAVAGVVTAQSGVFSGAGTAPTALVVPDAPASAAPTPQASLEARTPEPTPSSTTTAAVSVSASAAPAAAGISPNPAAVDSAVETAPTLTTRPATAPTSPAAVAPAQPKPQPQQPSPSVRLTVPGRAPGVKAFDVMMTSVNVSWSAAPRATSYTITAVGVGGVPSVTVRLPAGALRTSLIGLVPGTQYTVMVTPQNAAGAGPTNSAMALTKPIPPKLTTVTFAAKPGAAPGTVLVTWTPMPGAASYSLELSLPGAAASRALSWRDGRTSATITGLTPRTRYEIIMYATNDAQNGPTSSQFVTTP